jgi:aromatic ring-opening dioxygenase catalytic subunit (LigB family)
MAWVCHHHTVLPDYGSWHVLVTLFIEVAPVISLLVEKKRQPDAYVDFGVKLHLSWSWTRLT